MSERGHRQVPHTADLALELWAPGEAELLAEGAGAIVELLTGEAPAAAQAGAIRDVSIEALDPEDRLVRFLNEVLLLAIVDGFVTGRVEVALRGDGGLVARLFGEEGARARVRSELKGVTYHDVHLARAPDSVRARVVIDV